MTIQITEPARHALHTLCSEEQRFLRITVAPGGCAGMSYSAVIDSEPDESDITVYSQDSIIIVTNTFSKYFLDGLKIDYSSDLIKPGFHLSNTFAFESCGCGSSFAL